MRKILLIVFAVALSAGLQAQIPPGYYDSAYNGVVPKTCAELKTALAKILAKDTDYVAYNSADGSYDTQDAVNNYDRHRNDANTADIIWDMYTDNPAGPELYTFTPVTGQCGSSFPPQVGACYNREHAYPRAWFGDDFHVRGDLHNIFATDGETNARHANWPYAEVGATSWTSPAGAKLGTCSFPGYNGTVFEVIDEYKGDFARVMFYMVTAYESGMPAWKNFSTADSVLDGTTWPSLDPWAIKQWYKWHIQDPVSQKELSRNDSVFSVQGNRNPFIDHPEFVALIWQCTGLLPVTITSFTGIKNNDAVLLQWTAGNEINFRQYEIERSIDGVHFSTSGIVTAANKTSYSFTDNHLPEIKTIFYRLKMLDADGKFSYSKVISIHINRRSKEFTIYPNPAVHEINLALQTPLTVGSVIRITDIAGKQLIINKAVTGQQNIKIATDKLPAGKYFITIMNNEAVLYDSFVIIQ